VISPEVFATIAVAYASAVGGGIIWGIRLEGRVNTHTTLFDEREKLATSRHDDLTNRLDRIEQKLDSHNGNTSHSARV
jgi:hypothetical protein